MRKKLMCLLSALALLCGAALAEEGEIAFQTSNPPVAAGYPVPDVPECARVDDAYFDDAVFVGDSIISGLELYGAMKHGEIIGEVGMSPGAAARDRRFKLNGKSCRLVDYLEPLAPAKIYIMLGTNGVHTLKAERVLEDMESLLNALIERMPNALIYIMSITPMTNGAMKQYATLSKGRILLYNEGLRELAEKHNAYFLDIFSLFSNENDLLSRDWAAGDGYHLSRAAYHHMADYLYTHAIPLADGAVSAFAPEDFLVVDEEGEPSPFAPEGEFIFTDEEDD